MIITSIKMLKAEEGKLLHKGDIYTSAVLLKEGETEEGWEEVDESELPEEEEEEQ